jgi:hypothetical protein
MDPATEAITSLPEISLDNNIANILMIYNKHKHQEPNITTDTVKSIFKSIDEIYYNNLFTDRFLASGPIPKRPDINYKDTNTHCEGTDAFLAAMEYDDGDISEIQRYDYGFHAALTCINSITTQTIYYSGGYITRSKLIFIILMLLHESIHIIEYKDTLLTLAKSEHTSYFFKYGYKRFKILSRLSEVMDDTRLLIPGSPRRIIEINNLQYDTSDGTRALFDHSSSKVGRRIKEIGYIIHDIFRTNTGFRFLEEMNYPRNGAKRKTIRSKRRLTKRS